MKIHYNLLHVLHDFFHHVEAMLTHPLRSRHDTQKYLEQKLLYFHQDVMFHGQVMDVVDLDHLLK